MFLQDPNNALMLLELNMQLASPLFAQSPIVLQRKVGERMNLSEWSTWSCLIETSQQFYENNTEMIITKSGRRMFSSVQINVNGLEKRENYYVLMEIAPGSDRRHKYCGYQNGGENSNMGGRSFAGPTEPQQLFGYRIYKHPESPATWSHWMDNPITFNKLKLTSNINDPNNNVVLTSMHKYVPRIWIETEFITMTAYQNENITKLKINNNPFAKGFREMGQSRFKRKHHSIDHQAQSDSSPDERVSLIYDSESNQPNDPPLKPGSRSWPALQRGRSGRESRHRCESIPGAGRGLGAIKFTKKKKKMKKAIGGHGYSWHESRAIYSVNGCLCTNRFINLASCVQCPDHPRTRARSQIAIDATWLLQNALASRHLILRPSRTESEQPHCSGSARPLGGVAAHDLTERGYIFASPDQKLTLTPGPKRLVQPLEFLDFNTDSPLFSRFFLPRFTKGSNLAVVRNADGSEAAVASVITGSRSERTSTCIRDRILNADRRAIGRSAAGLVHGQQCFRSRNLTDRFQFRRLLGPREVKPSLLLNMSLTL
ncbi:hypothetical protein DBV15_09464 [Temnothorax longispinosus]|uniref:T-box domain-containing protein n=1 Tax=Temnothorax longispinosus TaxID=300112 RepID=A0A4S2KI67_9HYME|nr:hypothetical protein DBV15_09464 [Temnothorax longispinosus]